MKKFTILFLIFTFCMMAFISGCSKDEENDPTGPSINPDDYDYYMTVSAEQGREDYGITIFPMVNVEITSMEVSVNGVDVIMVNYTGSTWSGSTEMAEGQTYQIEAVINEVDYSFTIQTTHIPIVNWPVDWIVTEPTTITWSLASDAEYQDFYATATDYTIWDDNYVDLNNSDRSFTIPANWVDPLLPNYSIMLMEMNFAFEDNLIVNCMSFDESFYGGWGRESKHNIIEISKDMYKKIFK